MRERKYETYSTQDYRIEILLIPSEKQSYRAVWATLHYFYFNRHTGKLYYREVQLGESFDYWHRLDFILGDFAEESRQ